MKIQLGFDYVETMSINGEEYVKLVDVPRIATFAYSDYLYNTFRDAMNDMKLLADTKKGIVTVINTKEQK